MVCLPEENHRVNDILDEVFTSDELFEQWQCTESKAFMCGGSSPDTLVSCHRDTIVGFVRYLTIWINHAEAWHSTMALVDSYNCKKGLCEHQWSDVEVPVIAACALLAVKSIDQVCVSRRTSDISEVVQYCAQCVPEAVTAEVLTRAEIHVLQVLEGRVNLTSVQEWCFCFLRRLAAYTGWEELAYRTAQAINYWSEFFTAQVPCTAGLPPKKLATGAFALTLMNTGLLSPNVCKPREVDVCMWSDMPIISHARLNFNRYTEGFQQSKSLPELDLCSVAKVAKAVGTSVSELKTDVFVAVATFDMTAPCKTY